MCKELTVLYQTLIKSTLYENGIFQFLSDYLLSSPDTQFMMYEIILICYCSHWQGKSITVPPRHENFFTYTCNLRPLQVY